MSTDEIELIQLIIRNHMRPILLAQSDDLPSRRAIYRFHRDCREAGVDVCLHSLADTLATYGASLSQDIWNRLLDVVRILLEAFWEHYEVQVSPPILVNGNDLMRIFDLQPGPLIGRILEAIREAQATGEIHDRREALEFTRAWLDNN